ncbi:AAEL001966-PA [Aedes aegypti]|uniref:AAEL001966-PA n=1 Tax=Aedes aegypti TaxID=7159 RepID=Q17JM8_AEDAE|nr:AAEL001966-PA [Aedes aegypti]
MAHPNMHAIKQEVPDDDYNLNAFHSGAIPSVESECSVPHVLSTSTVTPFDSNYVKQEPELDLEPDELPLSEASNETTEQSVKSRIQRTTLEPNKCYICDRSCDDEETLEIHLLAHTEMIPYTCEECTESSGKPVKLTCLGTLHRHFQMHAKAFKCSQCPARRSTLKGIKQHTRKSHGQSSQAEYHCDICGKKSKNKESLLTHKMAHKALEDGRFTCSYCSKKCISNKLLIEHERIHTNERPYQCKFCPKTFKTKQQSLNHEKLHTGEKGFHCDTCGERFRYKRTLVRHMTRIHREPQEECTVPGNKETHIQKGDQEPKGSDSVILPDEHKCYICQQQVEDSESRELHLTVHEDMLPYDCDHCRQEEVQPSTITSLTLLHRHFQLHAIYLKCPKCPFWTTTEELVAAHMTEKHTQNDEIGTPCETCGKKVKKRNLKRHMLHHKAKEDGLFSCSFCGISFSTKPGLVTHERRHTNEQPFQCKYCPKKFRATSALTCHERIHTGDKPYSCEICGKSFGWKGSLSAHQEAAHGPLLEQTGSLKVYKCELPDCGFSANKKAQLALHRAKHLMKFQCSFCPKRFTNGNEQKNHELTHTGIKNFHCELCQKGFRTKSSLANHIALHNGNRPFVCKSCGKAYVQKIQLKVHLSKHIECQNAEQMEFS